MKFTWT